MVLWVWNRILVLSQLVNIWKCFSCLRKKEKEKNNFNYHFYDLFNMKFNSFIVKSSTILYKKHIFGTGRSVLSKVKLIYVWTERSEEWILQNYDVSCQVFSKERILLDIAVFGNSCYSFCQWRYTHFFLTFRLTLKIS